MHAWSFGQTVFNSASKDILMHFLILSEWIFTWTDQTMTEERGESWSLVDHVEFIPESPAGIGMGIQRLLPPHSCDNLASYFLKSCQPHWCDSMTCENTHLYGRVPSKPVPTWMSQEVSKWLVNGLLLLIVGYIGGYNPFTNHFVTS